MVELAGWKTNAGLVFGGHEGPIEPKAGEWVSDERTKTKENDVIPEQCNNKCYIIDSKTVEKAINKLKGELDILTKLGNDYIELSGEIADWMSGVTLVQDGFFPEHTKAVAANELGLSDLHTWPLPFVDWDSAVEALKKKYVFINYDGVKYWVKRPA